MSRNFKMLRVATGGFPGLAAILRGDVRPVKTLPEDAKCVRAGYDPMTDDAVFVFESVEFGGVPEGRRIPELELLFESVPKP